MEMPPNEACERCRKSRYRCIVDRFPIGKRSSCRQCQQQACKWSTAGIKEVWIPGTVDGDHLEIVRRSAPEADRESSKDDPPAHLNEIPSQSGHSSPRHASCTILYPTFSPPVPPPPPSDTFSASAFHPLVPTTPTLRSSSPAASVVGPINGRKRPADDASSSRDRLQGSDGAEPPPKRSREEGNEGDSGDVARVEVSV